MKIPRSHLSNVLEHIISDRTIRSIVRIYKDKTGIKITARQKRRARDWTTEFVLTIGRVNSTDQKRNPGLYIKRYR